MLALILLAALLYGPRRPTFDLGPDLGLLAICAIAVISGWRMVADYRLASRVNRSTSDSAAPLPSIPTELTGVRWLRTVIWVLAAIGAALISDHALNAPRPKLQPVNPIAAATARLLREPGWHFTVRASYSYFVSGTAYPDDLRTVSIAGQGVFDARRTTGRSKIVVRGLKNQRPERVTAIGGGGVVWVRTATNAGRLPPGKHWVRLVPNTATRFLNGVLDQTNPTQALNLLLGMGKIPSHEAYPPLAGTLGVQSAPVHGIPVFTYDATDRSGGVQASVDGSGRLRAMTLQIPFQTYASRYENLSVSWSFYGLGTPPTIKLPPRDEVLALGPLDQRTLGDLTGQHFAAEQLRFRAPTPLSKRVYASRANRICSRHKTKFAHLRRQIATLETAIQKAEEEGSPSPRNREAIALALIALERHFEYWNQLTAHLLARLKFLTPPDSDSARLSTWLDQVGLEGATAQQMAESIRARNLTEFRRAQRQYRWLGDQAGAFAWSYRMGSCGRRPHGPRLAPL